MNVIAPPGIKCPKEGSPREYITDSQSESVPDDSTYYLRLIADGSLLIVPSSPEEEEKEPAPKKKRKAP